MIKTYEDWLKASEKDKDEYVFREVRASLANGEVDRFNRIMTLIV